jgi:hypothetical protein
MSRSKNVLVGGFRRSGFAVSWRYGGPQARGPSDRTHRGSLLSAECVSWGGLWSRVRGDEAIKGLLSSWPVDRPANWTARVNTPLTAKELDRLRLSIERGAPLEIESC